MANPQRHLQFTLLHGSNHVNQYGLAQIHQIPCLL